jgi:hypothetical protein
MLGLQHHTKKLSQEQKGWCGMAVESIVGHHEVQAPNWLVSAVNASGERRWYVRIKIDGLYARRIGPFESAEEALDYEETLRKFLNWLVCDSDAPGWFVEDELGAAYLKGSV